MTTSTFLANQRLPIHRWFRYSAGFSGAWAEAVIRERTSAHHTILDPFAGVATTLVAAQLAGRHALGVEAHPFVARIARAKLTPCDPDALERAAQSVLAHAESLPREAACDDEPELLRASYSPDALADLRRLHRAIEAQGEHPLLWLALVAILRACSSAGTAPWQYVLPNRRKARVAMPFVRFPMQTALMSADLCAGRTSAVLHHDDARTCASIADASVDLVLTSPPYPNNYDYADATRLEQTFFGDVREWRDLHTTTRRHLVRACSQHTAADRLALGDLLADPHVAPIRDALTGVCEALAAIRASKPGKKTYHTMIAAYFVDLARVWQALARVVRPGGEVCFVIGDSAPYGVHVPVDDWLARLADAAGFTPTRTREIRARNVKWKNRKHRVPLRELELWLTRRR
ncbi:DNA methyltransferase [Sandaracinus amylolyticus]|uniref:site-specific DNA-methyltransferase (cytosine-N(4)-specific) n=1 Tax=Sandaracinus amylolyticus TaxID=927083 RepID=A0A0F6YMG2_9BACT|nr:DNA methyltransferase [Sandaracinus amylolyticus]AKF11328.1 DNA modification methyltransferase [Sandaracinus amylolyticus]